MQDNNKKAWDSKLILAVWADRITKKKATRKSPFELVYGTQARMPMQNILLVYKYILKKDLDIPEPMEDMIEQLVELDEIKKYSTKTQ